MLTAYQIALVFLAYFAWFYLCVVDSYRQVLRDLVAARRDQVAYYVNIVLGCIHMAFGLYIIGCVIHFFWNL